MRIGLNIVRYLLKAGTVEHQPKWHLEMKDRAGSESHNRELPGY